ncbi:MAG: undecaprenyldiphospho-muramoylpentapeptide beta-N-acetylglucosaminyltransferase [Methylotenera sp.]|nr:undecaprenyldiphospho-muramoylpentapeptide beta-N-acetylglucosaminyltransferase [Oligoflexia bacterium]
MSEKNPTLIVAGGGTGGHVLAGIAIADAWKITYPQSKIIFVGAHGGIEEKLVPRAGYPLELLSLGSLKRVSLARKLRTAVQLPLSLLKSAVILLRDRPAGVIGVGGYASGPLVLMGRLMGWMWGVRVAILEQNAVPGMTNRILSRIAHQVLIAFPGIESQFKGRKVNVTGNPVRNVMKPMPPASRDPFTIFIFGGSQGAMGINTLILDALPFLEDLKPRLRFIHQTGESDHARTLEGHRLAGTQARVEKFIYEMPEAYQAASLLVCRAGSSTLAEIAAVHRASVLIPFPYASDNHQEKNAQLFVDSGAAKLLVQFKSKGEDLAKIIRDCVENPGTLDTMEEAVSKFYRPKSAFDVVQILSGP